MKTLLRLSSLLLVSVSMTFLCGCAGTESSVKSTNSKSNSYVYPLTPEQANSVIYSAMMEASGTAPFRMSPPIIGYVAYKRILADSHTWQAMAIPVEYPMAGSNETGNAYMFEVKHSGSLIEGPFVASKIFKTIISDAETICQPVELTPAQTAKCKKIPLFSAKRKQPSTSSSEPQASGTGFFITEDGYLISNNHVVKDAAQIRIVTSNGKIDAKVIRTDSANDLALLKADGKFSALPIATSRSVNLGATVATVGFPDPSLQGFSPKLTKGEINALSGIQDDARYFQISVPVQPGNSGGALVDERGNVVGVVSAKLSARAALASSGQLPENVNYAVKSSFLLSFLESVPEVSAKLKVPGTSERKFEDVVKSAQDAAVLVLVY